MGFLAGKRLLITGVLNNARSPTAWHAPVAAKARTGLEATREASRIASRSMQQSSTRSSSSTATSAATSRSPACSPTSGKPGRSFDGFVHSIGFAPREASPASFSRPVARIFRIAHDISAYSFPAMAKAALRSCATKSALLTMTTSARACRPAYKHDGLAKASLEQRALPAATWPVRHPP